MTRVDVSRASEQDGTYPRPQLVRPAWADLCGEWGFAADDADEGLALGWHRAVGGFDARITVPFPPESAASGIGDTGYHPVVWYRRTLTAADLRRAGFGGVGGLGGLGGGEEADGSSPGEPIQGDRLLLHFGAVDYRADVWLGGEHLGRHDGGQTPFSFDATEAVAAAAGRELTLVVRAEDDPLDVAQPRGKQDWRPEPHAIWYHRTTGIWQPVWLEAVPTVHLGELAWRTDVPDASVTLTARLSRRPRAPLTLTARLTHGGELLAEHRVRVLDQDVRVRIDVPRQANGQQYEDLLWSPERPTLVDATIELSAEPALDTGPDTVPAPGVPGRPAQPRDVVGSYLGIRSTAVAHGAFVLNDRPYYLRSVLEQGYWPQSHLAAPSADALRAEVQVIKDLGFNAARVHQKAEDPRFLYWADRLGLAIWAETANAYAFSPRSVHQLTTEWLDLVRRDVSHPCIVTWVPLNESWGVQHGAHDPAQQHYGIALANLTRALDPTRPVVSNDGWEHTDSDIWTVHDYAERGAEIRSRYATPEAVAELLDGFGPAGRRMRLVPVPDRGQPVMLTEFGGVSYASGREDAWGYSTATDDVDFEKRLLDLLDAVRDCAPIAGYCYTQLTDTGQETNGLLDADRRPKLPLEVLRRCIDNGADGRDR